MKPPRRKPQGRRPAAAPEKKPAPAAQLPSEVMRIQRALARAGVTSRRKAEDLIAAGRVTVNGSVAVIGQPVDPAKDAIMVDGKRIAAPAAGPTWIVFNKPLGVMTT